MNLFRPYRNDEPQRDERWLLMVLFAPWTLLLLPFVGVWFDLFAALFLLYDRLDKALGIEESIARAFPDQVPRYDR